jgi:hypothetical protein
VIGKIQAGRQAEMTEKRQAGRQAKIAEKRQAGRQEEMTGKRHAGRQADIDIEEAGRDVWELADGEAERDD